MATAETTLPDISTSRQVLAVVQRGYGGAEVLVPGAIDRPTPSAGEVLVEVRAAALDRGTWHLMHGQPYLVRLAFGLRAPKRPVPGLDLAGVVVATGPDVTRFQPGDEVFGIGKGSLAALALARADKLAPRPASLTFTQAAAVPVSGLTALQALTDVGRLERGQHVLVTGASGGVGSYAVQIARALGAEVTGVASTAKLDLVTSLGADHVLDYTRDDITSGTTRYDLIVDIGGNTPVSRLRRALQPTGTLVIVGSDGGGRWLGGLERQLGAILLSPFVRQRLTTFISKERATDLERLAALIESGQVIPTIDRVFPLPEVRDAMRHLERGRARGKVVIAT
jgi:NADPH:quinone reductase-like Zn-dependent oxidoreductase